jgi:hypothetical protein
LVKKYIGEGPYPFKDFCLTLEYLKMRVWWVFPAKLSLNKGTVATSSYLINEFWS